MSYIRRKQRVGQNHLAMQTIPVYLSARAARVLCNAPSYIFSLVISTTNNVGLTSQDCSNKHSPV